MERKEVRVLLCLCEGALRNARKRKKKEKRTRKQQTEHQELWFKEGHQHLQVRGEGRAQPVVDVAMLGAQTQKVDEMLPAAGAVLGKGAFPHRPHPQRQDLLHIAGVGAPLHQVAEKIDDRVLWRRRKKGQAEKRTKG